MCVWISGSGELHEELASTGADRQPCHNQDGGIRKAFLGLTAVGSEATFKAVAFEATLLLLLL